MTRRGAPGATAPPRYRRPTVADLGAVLRVHGDPRTNVFNPDGPDDEAAARERLAGWIDHWNSHGFGYEVIENRAGTVLGMAGIRHERWLGVPVLNLYYRLAPEAWGLGIASAAGRRALATAARVAPDLPVLVLTTPDNVPSRRTAAAIGLRRRPDLEIVLNSIPAIIFTSTWPTDPPGLAPSAVTGR